MPDLRTFHPKVAGPKMDSGSLSVSAPTQRSKRKRTAVRPLAAPEAHWTRTPHPRSDRAYTIPYASTSKHSRTLAMTSSLAALLKLS